MNSARSEGVMYEYAAMLDTFTAELTGKCRSTVWLSSVDTA
jgi:hypothetical protein